MARIITIRNAMLIIILVEVPNPLSINLPGTVSSNDFGVAHSRTPQEKPRMNLPKQIIQKLSTSEKQVPISPTILN